jgi:hypothetical protein
MGYLTIFSETGFPHAGCYLEYDRGMPEWLGFFPWPSGSSWDNPFLGGNGRILTDDRESQIEYYIRYWFQDRTLSRARNNVVVDYWPRPYQFLVNDCVTFARDVAAACGLKTTGGPAWVPSSLVYDLKRLNGNWSQFNKRPLPWR